MNEPNEYTWKIGERTFTAYPIVPSVAESSWGYNGEPLQFALQMSDGDDVTREVGAALSLIDAHLLSRIIR